MLPFCVNGIWLSMSEGSVKHVLNCVWVIHVSTEAGEAEETAACMYIHYGGLGMGGEIMCFSSVSGCQNKVHTVLELHGCTPHAPGRVVAIRWNIRAAVLCDKIITGYEFICLWWCFEKIKITVSGGSWSKPHLRPAGETKNLILFTVTSFSPVFWTDLSGA